MEIEKLEKYPARDFEARLQTYLRYYEENFAELEHYVPHCAHVLFDALSDAFAQLPLIGCITLDAEYKPEFWRSYRRLYVESQEVIERQRKQIEFLKEGYRHIARGVASEEVQADGYRRFALDTLSGESTIKQTI